MTHLEIIRWLAEYIVEDLEYERSTKPCAHFYNTKRHNITCTKDCPTCLVSYLEKIEYEEE